MHLSGSTTQSKQLCVAIHLSEQQLEYAGDTKDSVQVGKLSTSGTCAAAAGPSVEPVVLILPSPVVKCRE